MSPANSVTVGCVVVLPPLIVTEPWALRKPLAVARTLYVPPGAVRLKVPSGLAATEVSRVLPL